MLSIEQLSSSFLWKKLVHLLLHVVQLLCADYETVEGTTHLDLKEGAEVACFDQLAVSAHSCQAETFCFLVVGTLAFGFFDFE